MLPRHEYTARCATFVSAGRDRPLVRTQDLERIWLSSWLHGITVVIPLSTPFSAARRWRAHPRFIDLSGETAARRARTGRRFAGGGDTSVPVWAAGHSCLAARTRMSLLPMKIEDGGVLAPSRSAHDTHKPCSPVTDRLPGRGWSMKRGCAHGSRAEICVEIPLSPPAALVTFFILRIEVHSERATASRAGN